MFRSRKEIKEKVMRQVLYITDGRQHLVCIQLPLLERFAFGNLRQIDLSEIISIKAYFEK